MFYTESEKSRIDRKLRRLDESLEIIDQQSTKNSNLLTTMNTTVNQVVQTLATLTQNDLTDGERIDEMLQDHDQDIGTMSEQVENLKAEVSRLTEALQNVLTTHERASELSVKYFEHATRFEQGIAHAEIVSHYMDKEGKLKTELNWNKEFIQNLIKSGFTGKDDNEVIQLWLNNLLYQFREDA